MDFQEQLLIDCHRYSGVHKRVSGSDGGETKRAGFDQESRGWEPQIELTKTCGPIALIGIVWEVEDTDVDNVSIHNLAMSSAGFNHVLVGANLSYSPGTYEVRSWAGGSATLFSQWIHHRPNQIWG